MNNKCTLLMVACLATGVLTTNAVETPATIPDGTGVYFLKSGSRGINGGKYIATYDRGICFMGDTVPSANQSRGQWYIVETGGKYSAVDRNANTALILNSDIFAVQGMSDSYLFGTQPDTITVEQVPVDLNDKYLGSLYFTPDELANQGYALNLVSDAVGGNDLYAFTSDTMVQIMPKAAEESLVFKLVPNDTTVVGGAWQLGDTLSVISYRFTSRFSNGFLTENVTHPKGIKFSTSGSPLGLAFYSTPGGLQYTVRSTDGRWLFSDAATSYLGLSSADGAQPGYFNLVGVEAPDYGTLIDGAKKIGSGAKYLTMNPLNRFAEMKTTGQEILKSEYAADNFSLRVSKAGSNVPGKNLYYISSALRIPGAAVDPSVRYYMASLRDSNFISTNNAIPYYRVGFITSDTITTMADSPALFAFKTAEEGGYYLENQKEMSRAVTDRTPYVGYVNGVVVMQVDPVTAFTVDATYSPTGNKKVRIEELDVVAGTGVVTIRNAAGKKVLLSNILGKPIGTAVISSDYFTLPAARGIVVVSVEGETPKKVLVK